MFVDLNLKLGVRPEAYAPLSVPSWKHRKDTLKELNVLKDPVILSLAEKYEKTPAQVVLN
jgi:diketogulonate reductase-like aldo/keto reductase